MPAARDSICLFLSHTSRNDPFVAQLRQRLEGRRYTVLEDSQLKPGDTLPDEVREFIDRSEAVVAVVSAAAVDSGWVRRELRYGKKIGKRLIPLLLPGATTRHLRAILGLPEPERGADLEDWPAEVIAIRTGSGPGALDSLMPSLMDALEGVTGGGQVSAPESRAVTPLADLVLRLRHTRFQLVEDERGAEVRRPVATARLAFYPPDAAEPALESPEFELVVPLGTIEAGDLSFYLERYHITPFGSFAKRAREIEGRLPAWGEDLWDALGPDDHGHERPVEAWRALATTAQRRFTIEAPPHKKLHRRASADEKKAHEVALEAANDLLGLPWELLHDDVGYLFHDGLGVRVRRSLPGGETSSPLDEAMRKPPLRVLVVCARPEAEGIGYIDHRVSVRPVTEALNALGGLAQYDILSPPTFPALRDALKDALRVGRPYHIVHFDGHGVYDRVHGLGALVFEHPDSTGKLREREPQIVTADKLGEELRNAGVGLFFLEACQSATSEQSPEASVAGRLLQSGVASVAAMSHSVLVETARRFTEVFYPALVEGERVGEAMLKAQHALWDDRRRGWGWEPRGDEPGKLDRRPLELHDWFVPVLYQDGEDPVLLAQSPPAKRIREELRKDRVVAVGNLPDPPDHAFVGRSRELLAAERLLIEQDQRYVVLRGEGGEGKTTLASELARWLVGTRRYDRAAFFSVENLPEDPVRAMLTAWGEQLRPGFSARADNAERAEDLLTGVLKNLPTVLVLDNLESILPPPEGSEAAAARVFDQDTLDGILGVCSRLLDRASNTRIVFTSREGLPAGYGFDGAAHHLEIGRLSSREGMELVARVLAHGAADGGDDSVSAEAVQAEREEEIEELVTTVNGHARSLVLLTPELARRGLRATIDELAEIMADLEKRHPGERERSLFASVELSLRRLPVGVRAKLAPLGVFRGGASLLMILPVIEVSPDEGLELAHLLHQVGLGEMTAVIEDARRPSDLFLRFDPALAPVLLRSLREASGGAEAAARVRWAVAYRKLAGYLAQREAQDAHLAARLSLLELPNLLGALRFYDKALAEATPSSASDIGLGATSESVIGFASAMGSLLQGRGRREAMSAVSVILERARRRLEEGGDGKPTHAGYLAANQQINRHLDAGRFGEAIAAARTLVEKLEANGDHAYEAAGYDSASAHFILGRALEQSGQPEAALESLAVARQRFESLAKALVSEEVRKLAARMASICLVEEGDALMALGRLDLAAAQYETAIRSAEHLEDSRQVATNKFQLGTVRYLQRRHDEALELYHESRKVMESLGESLAVGVAWHQIGIVYHGAHKFEEAESAYQRSLALKIQQGDRRGEAATRNQLGIVYGRMKGREEDAVRFHHEAAIIYADRAVADALNEGRARNNAAEALVALRRFDEARAQAERALECKKEYGVNASQWTTWGILQRIETAVGDIAAATKARRNAVAAYAQARRQGWQKTEGAAASLCEVVGVIVEAQNSAAPPGEIAKDLPQLEASVRDRLQALSTDTHAPTYLHVIAPKLLAILDGARDPALCDDAALDYDDAVELMLLLEKIH